MGLVRAGIEAPVAACAVDFQGRPYTDVKALIADGRLNPASKAGADLSSVPWSG